MKIFEISPGLFVWSVVTFLVLMAFLYKFAFRPLLDMQKKRQDEIHGSIVEAETLVEVGELEPDAIHVPSIFVKRVFQGGSYQKWIEKRTVRA